MLHRLFVAVNLPEALRDGIYSRLSAKIPSAECKVVRAGNLHLTLKFLGYVPEERLEDIKKAVAELAGFSTFRVRISGVGHFNRRVIWIGIGNGGRLSAIANALNARIKEGKSEEGFSAHLTIARNKTLRRAEFDKLMERLKAEGFSAEADVKSIELMESVLSKLGPEYKVVFSIGLTGPK